MNKTYKLFQFEVFFNLFLVKFLLMLMGVFTLSVGKHANTVIQPPIDIFTLHGPIFDILVLLVINSIPKFVILNW